MRRPTRLPASDIVRSEAAIGGAGTSDVNSHVERIMQLATGAVMMQALAVAAELDLADLLAGRPMPVADLSHAIGCPEGPTRRLLRSLVSVGLCEQRDDDCFSLTGAGRLLQRGTGASLHDWAIWCGRHLWPQWGNLKHSLKTGESVRQVMAQRPIWDQLDEDAETAAVFDGAMAELTRFVASSVLDCYDFSRAKVVADVAGGRGDLLQAILSRHPGARGVLFDRPHAIEGARRRFVTSGLDTRCEFATGSFFDFVPPGADVYLLKNVLHDWDDERCIEILRRCRTAMGSHARLLIVEGILPSRWRNDVQHQHIAKRDLTMLVGPGGCERLEAEFRALLSATDFTCSRIVPAQLGLFVIEASPSS
jgi:orsellinic acid C2-O-methyltransferase